VTSRDEEGCCRGRFKSCQSCEHVGMAIGINSTNISTGARGSVVGLGTMLQAGRSRVGFPMGLLDFSIDLILPVAL
jgi:hypothetical protein